MIRISSRDNPLIKELSKLARQGVAYRKLGRFWVEGDHLCRAALERGQAGVSYGVVVISAEAIRQAVAAINLSPGGDLVEAAAALFSALRQLDALAPTAIAVVAIPAFGLGEAIRDRLARAAAPRG
jgi:tRNA G18 (ribose-2'-O)-methylase SpoU